MRYASSVALVSCVPSGIINFPWLGSYLMHLLVRPLWLHDCVEPDVFIRPVAHLTHPEEVG